jgi:glycosyltransferase involved in cell wall biosynthesis
MKNIFIPMLGRVNVFNRDGSEIRLSNFIKEFYNKNKISLLMPNRQISILKNQKINIKKLNIKIIPDILNSNSDHLLNVLLTYAFRIISACFLKYPKNIDIIYIPSDFLFDIMPGIICKIKNPKAKMYVCLFLICPNPFIRYENIYKKKINFPNFRQLIYFLSQKISLYLVKKYKGIFLVLNKIDNIKIKKMNANCRIVTMGVDTKAYNKTVPSKKKFDAIFVGRFHPQKGIEELIKSWDYLINVINKKYTLAIIGGGNAEYIEDIKKKISNLRLENYIKLLGFLDGDKKISFLKSSKVSVIPSLYESYGMTVIEAGACNLPVIAYKIPVFKSLFNNMINFAKVGDFKNFAIKVDKTINKKNQDLDKKFFYYCKTLDWKNVFLYEKKLLKI